MAQNAKKLGKETLYFLYAIPLCGIGGIAALDIKLTVLAIALFALMGLCFSGATVFGVLTYTRANAEVDQIVRAAKARQGQSERHRGT